MERMRLLAVDDNMPLAELIVRVAERCGYDARPLANSFRLPQMLDEWTPEILTLDLSMPQEDGMSLLAVLEEKHFAGRIVIVSGQQGWLRQSACRLGAARGLRIVRDLEKPVEIAVLREVLMKLARPATAE